MKRAYNQAYLPAAPVLRVRFGNSETIRFTQPIDALVDSGADITIAPVKLMRRIGAVVNGFQSARGQWGDAKTVKMYIVDAEVEGINFPGIWVLGDDGGEEVVLGRNLLNRMRILLDGLGEKIEIVSY